MAKGSKTIITGAIIILLSFLYQELNLTFLDKNTKLNFTQEKEEIVQSDEFYKVERVVDGDTLVVKINNLDEKVRLIGINTPEIVDPRTKVECFGKEASNKMKSFTEGERVRLEYDGTQGIRDAYDRLLAYVFLEDEQMLNRKMISEGYAYEYTYLTPYKYQKEFKELQNLARISERGLWAKETCAGKK